MELTLEQIAQGKCDNREIVLPQVQRGLVWNAVRAEVLWDSILRGLPIGTFSIKEATDKWELMDGQQRSNAIAMAFAVDKLRQLTPARMEEAHRKISRGETGLGEDVFASVLWLDIAKGVPPEGELCDEHVGGNTSRRYFFKVTTAAHPWGYGNAGSETNNDVYPEYKRKEALLSYNKVGQWKIGDRPFPYEVWPIDAAFPVPMAVVVAFSRQATDVSLAAFQAWCQGQEWIRESNWYRYNGFDAHSDPDCEKNWEGIVKQVRKALSSCQVQANVVEVEPKDVGIYFSRMNKAGVVPTVEDIQYCLLKDSLRDCVSREIWNRFDVLAAKIGIAPSRLLSLAVRFVQNADKESPERLRGELLLSEVLACADQLKSFLDCALGLSMSNGRKVSLFSLIDEAIKRFCGQDPVLLWVLHDIASANDGIVFLWYLRHVALGADVKMPNRLTDAGLVTYLAWFSEDVVRVVGEMWKSGCDVRSGLYRAMRIGLLQPISKYELSEIAGVLEDWSGIDFVGKLRDRWNDDKVRNRLARIWCGFSYVRKKCDFQPAYGKSLLVFSCRKYLQDVFRGYAPGQPQWNEQNTPWDFDHVIPKAWLREDSDDSLTAACSSLIWSVGNALPVPFQINRSKGCQAADIYYPYRKNEVPDGMTTAEGGCLVECAGAHLTPALMKVACAEPEIGFDAQGPDESALAFCRETFRRLKAIYLDWYETCGIASVFEVTSANVAADDVRNRLMKALMELGRKDGLDCGLWYVSGDRECPVSCDWHLLHPWVSFGVRVKGALVAVSADDFDGLCFEVGLRKSPDASCVDAEWGRKLSERLAESGDSLGRFYNSGWWYYYRYYQSPRKIPHPNLDEQVKKAYCMFKSIYDIVEKAGLLEADKAGDSDRLKGDVEVG